MNCFVRGFICLTVLVPLWAFAEKEEPSEAEVCGEVLGGPSQDTFGRRQLTAVIPFYQEAPSGLFYGIEGEEGGVRFNEAAYGRLFAARLSGVQLLWQQYSTSDQPPLQDEAMGLLDDLWEHGLKEAHLFEEGYRINVIAVRIILLILDKIEMQYPQNVMELLHKLQRPPGYDQRLEYVVAIGELLSWQRQLPSSIK